VVDPHGLIVSWGQLPHHFSVFTAEAVAIIKAIKFAIELKGSYIICCDSLSTLQGVQNFCNNNKLLSEIRHLCIKNNSKIKLLWVPAHIGVIGNELADNAAYNHTWSTTGHLGKHQKHFDGHRTGRLVVV